MTVRIGFEPNGRVGQQVHDGPQLLALVEQERREGMAEIMQPGRSKWPQRRSSINRRLTFIS